MKIKRVRLLNWCQFEDTTLEFDDGLNGLLGVNGAGKSNAVDGLVYGLTGTSRNEGKLAGNVRTGTPARSKSGVEMELEHNGQPLLLKRYVKPQSQELVYAGEKWDRAEPISQKLAEVLKADEDILLRYVFVAQWRIFEFLTYTDAARAKFMAHLFKTEYAEGIWNALGDITVEVPQPDADADAVKIRLNANSTMLGAAETELLVLGGFQPFDEASDPDALVLKQWEQKQALTDEVMALRTQLSKAEDRFNDSEGHLQLAETDAAPVRDLVAGQREAEQQARNELARAEAVASAVKMREVSQKNLDWAKQGLEAVGKEPQKPKNYLPVGHPDERSLEEMKADLAAVERFLKTFDGSDKPAACPTCGTDTMALTGKVREFQRRGEALKGKCEKLAAVLKESRSYDTNITTFRWQQQNASARLRDAEAALAAVKVPELTSRPREELLTIIKECEENRAGLVELERAAQTCKERMFADRSRRDTLRESLNSKQKKLDTLVVNHGQMLASKVTLEEKRARYATTSAAKARVEVLSKAVKDDEALLKKVEESIRAARRAASAARHLQEVRDVFHRNRLPRRLAEAHLSRAEREINEILVEFNSPFMVHTQENLRFRAHFRDGREVPAERLSGGEMTVFALAFRMAVNSRYARELGLLVLDEPTAGLDEENLNCLETALNRLRAVSRSRGLQVILITHEKALHNRFDHEIVLPSRR